MDDYATNEASKNKNEGRSRTLHSSFASTARFASALAVAAVLLGSGMALGAAGQALFLGRNNNSGDQSTGLTTSSTGAALRVAQNGLGPAIRATAGSAAPLALAGPPNQPPMVVNSAQRVTNLNADRVDGMDASTFMPASTYVVSQGGTVLAGEFNTLGASCDDGDVLLSGGIAGVNLKTHVNDNQPYNTALWQIDVVNTALTDDDLEVFALCADFAPQHDG